MSPSAFPKQGEINGRDKPAEGDSPPRSDGVSRLEGQFRGAGGGQVAAFQRPWDADAEHGGDVPASAPSAVSPGRTVGPSWLLERWLIRQALKASGNPPLPVRLWDGADVSAAPPSDQGRCIHIRRRSALWRLLWNPAFHFLEGYANGGIEIDGSLTETLCELNRRWRLRRPSPAARWYRDLWTSLRRVTFSGRRRNVAHHYDLGNSFYKLWLDEQLLYTCAYFPSPGMSLEAAQVAKMDHVCRKLDLRPGEVVIEAGCGWGAFALHMARHYGVRVRAYNISVEQVKYARERAAAEGLADRAEFILDDWRNIDGRCDAFVSIGMLEHVGPEQFRRLGQVIRRTLSPQGRGLIHSIGQNHPMPLNSWIEQKIFPGAQPPALQEIATIFPAGDLTVLDVENIRLHYALTLRHWLERFERSLSAIRDMYDDYFIRMWRMYLISSISAFETGGLQLFQVVFAPTASNDVPRTRAYQYRTG